MSSPALISCEPCGLKFETDNKLKTHIGDIHQQKLRVTIKEGHPLAEIGRDLNGKWICGCGLTEFGAGSRAKMRRHALNCEIIKLSVHEASNGSDSGTPRVKSGRQGVPGIVCPAACTSQSTLIDNPVLKAARISVSMRVCAIICEWCAFAVPTGGVVRHLRTQHGLRNIPGELEASAQNLLKSVPEIDYISETNTKGLLQPVEGLLLFEGFKCNLCESSVKAPFASISKEWMSRHVREKHRNAERWTEPQFSTEKVQTVFESSRLRYFAVTEPINSEQKQNSGIVLSAAIKELEGTLNSSKWAQNDKTCERSDARCTDAFLHRMRWPEEISHLNHDVVLQYVSAPIHPDKDFMLVKEACLHFLLNCGEKISYEVSFLMLQFIGPGADGENPGLHPMRSVQETKTAERYAAILCRLVLMTIRRCAICKFSAMLEIPEGLRNASLKFWGLIISSDSPCSPRGTSCQSFLQKVLREIFFVTLSDSAPRKCHTVYQFIMYSNLAENGGWLGPEEVGHTAAALQYACRCLIVATVTRRKLNTAECRELYRYLSTSRNTSFRSLTEMMSMAAAAHAAEATIFPKVFWSIAHDPWTTMVAGTELISVIGFIEGAHRLSRRTELLLERNVLLSLPSMPEYWKQLSKNLTDNLRDSAPGYSFVSTMANPSLINAHTMLLKHICMDEHLCDRFIDSSNLNDNGGIEWRELAVHSWLEDVCAFVDHLLTIMHIIGGGPARGEELAAIAFKNSERSRRNLYWVDQRVMTLTRYHKSQNMTGSPRLIPRFMPENVSLLILKYLVLVKPLETFLVNKLFSADGAAEEHSKYLYSKRGRRMTGPDVALAFTSRISSVLGLKLRFSQYRHVQKTLSKAFLKHGYARESERKDEKSMTSRLPFDEQAGHDEQTGERMYGITNFDHENITHGQMLDYWIVSNEWHALMKFEKLKRGWQLPPHKITSLLGPIHHLKSHDPDGFLDENIHDMTDSAHVKSQMSTRSFPQQFATISPVKILGKRFRDDRQATPISRREANTFGDLETYCDVRSSKMLLTGLRTFMRSERADFRSPEQMTAVREVLKGRSDLLIVMPTGSGKTLTYTLPAWLEEQNSVCRRTTVVVVPLASLICDIRRRCECSGVSVAEWRSRGESPTILLVSVETAITEIFLSHVNALAASSKLARIVIEEAHVSLTWQRFRPSMRKLGMIRPATAVPLVLVTATLPPNLENKLSAVLSTQFSCLRALTTRKNLKYEVRHLAGKKEGPYESHIQEIFSGMHSAILDTIKAQQHIFKAKEGRSIVYCPTRAECDRVTAILEKYFPTTTYHRGMSAESREVSEGSWRRGETRIMVATTAFGTGIDVGGVRLVIHAGHSCSMLDYAQETGRAGRNGQGAICLTLASPSYSAIVYGGRTTDAPGQDQMPEFQRFLQYLSLLPRGIIYRCRRKCLQEYLDGEGRDCLSLGAQCVNCDICEKVDSGSEKCPDGPEHDDERAVAKLITNSTNDNESMHLSQESAREGERSGSIVPQNLSLPAPYQRLPSPEGAERNRRDESHTAPPLCHEKLASPKEETFLEGEIRRDLHSVANIATRFHEGPDEIVAAGTVLSNHNRNVSINIMNKAQGIVNEMQRFCVLCAVQKGRFKQHERERCPLIRGRCLRCYARGHSVRSGCDIGKEIARVENPSCYRCGFCHDGSWGSQCDSNLVVARDISLALWHFKKTWLKQSFGPCSTFSNVEAFVKWLYNPRTQNSVPLLLVCIAWWDLFQNGMLDQQEDHVRLQNK